MLLYRQLRNVLAEEVIRDLAGDTNAIEELEGEWRQLCEDRTAMREVCFLVAAAKCNRSVKACAPLYCWYHGLSSMSCRCFPKETCVLSYHVTLLVLFGTLRRYLELTLVRQQT